jgi:signal transduction histidine kinase
MWAQMTARLTAAMRSDVLTICFFRVVAALTIFCLSVTDSKTIDFQLQSDDVACAGYSALALAYLGLSLKSPARSFGLNSTMILIDTVFVMIVPFIDLPAPSDFLVAVFAISMLIVLSSKVRWGDTAAGVAVVLLGSIATAVCIGIHPLQHSHDALLLRRIGLISAGAAFALWVSTRIGSRAVHLSRQHTMKDDAFDIHTLAAATCSLLDCTELSIQWHSNGEHIDHIRHSPETIEAASALAAQIGADREDACVVFLMPAAGATSTVVTAGGWTVASKPVRPPAGAALAFGTPGFCAKIQSRVGVGLVIASGFRRIVWDDIRMFHSISASLLACFGDMAIANAQRDREVTLVREDLARDLHDSVAQTLIGTKFWLGGLARMTSDSDRQAELARIRDAIEAEAVNVRKIVEGLRDGRITGLARPLRQALREALKELERQWQIRTDLTTEFAYGFLVDPVTVFTLRQILREVTANAVRHGQADILAVHCVIEGDEIKLDLADNGSGFVDDAYPRSLSERVSRLNGCMVVRSTPGDTTISISLPIGARLDEGDDSR